MNSTGTVREDLASNVVQSAVVFVISVFDAASLVAIRRTKRTPPNCRFLAMGLAVFDWLTMLGNYSRLWIERDIPRLFVERLTFGCVILAYNTVALMTFERVFLFTNVTCFFRYLSHGNWRVISTVVWISVFVVAVLLRFILCTFVYRELRTGSCYRTTSYIYASVISLVVTLATIGCVKLYFLVRSKSRRWRHPANRAVQGDTQCDAYGAWNRGSYHRDRSSNLIFTYMLTILLGIIGFLCFLAAGHAGDKFFSGMFVLSTFNCLANPCLYVFWFRECRMELLKICAGCAPRLQNKVDIMRMEIFDIVISTEKMERNNRSDVVTDFDKKELEKA